ncbi:activin receptor type-1 isoform X2 [Aplysia californica]|nr:activin receptor type-1 isoform X2 [Aplysia californica]XP_005096481.1 activin receptor type-1 isoform X2 [Aplysia californica]
MSDPDKKQEIQCVCDPPTCSQANHCNTTGKCYAYEDPITKHVVRNCFLEDQSALNCKSKMSKYSAFKCCDTNLCNQHLQPTLPSVVGGEGGDDTLDSTSIIIASAAGVLLLCVVVFFIIVLIQRHLRKRRERSLFMAPEARLLEEDLSGKGYQDQWSAGSGSGRPTLVRRTVGQHITYKERIGKGRFGAVWRGVWLDEDVAVKVFTSLEETSWNQETEIYNTGMLRHENILGYYASDTVGMNSCTHNLLIVHYHENGSLYDYLQCSDIDMEEMLILAHSASAGLAHLHTEIKEGTGRHGKPAIAHRDIKTKNILVKSNGQCCIGDLGHAVRGDVKLDAAPEKLLVGTKRYMAPEVLNKELKPDFFESFKYVDVYAFGLVMWEIARRARPFAEEYRVPFWDVVQADPSFEEMRQVVGVQQQRPPIPNKWSKEPLMCETAKLMRECWAQNPKVRLTILRVKKNLYSMLKSTSREHAEKVEKLSPKILDSSSSASSSRNNSVNTNCS